MVDDRADRSAAVVLLANQNVDAREFDHRQLFPLENPSANSCPKLLLYFHITRVDVHMADRNAHRIRRRNLRKRRCDKNRRQTEREQKVFFHMLCTSPVNADDYVSNEGESSMIVDRSKERRPIGNVCSAIGTVDSVQ